MREKVFDLTNESDDDLIVLSDDEDVAVNRAAGGTERTPAGRLGSLYGSSYRSTPSSTGQKRP